MSTYLRRRARFWVIIAMCAILGFGGAKLRFMSMYYETLSTYHLHKMLDLADAHDKNRLSKNSLQQTHGVLFDRLQKSLEERAQYHSDMCRQYSHLASSPWSHLPVDPGEPESVKVKFVPAEKPRELAARRAGDPNQVRPSPSGRAKKSLPPLPSLPPPPPAVEFEGLEFK